MPLDSEGLFGGPLQERGVDEDCLAARFEGIPALGESFYNEHRPRQTLGL